MPNRRLWVVTLLACMAIAPAQAERLGAFGQVFEIGEKDGVEQVKDKVRAREKDGSLKANLNAYAARVVQDLQNPAPIPGIVTSYQSRQRTIDPTYTFGSDYRDPAGKVMVAAGTRVNTLQGMPMTNQYLFIDGREFEQIAIAKRFVDADPIRHRVVLVAGDYNALADKLGVKVYFDQKGVLSQRFAIKQVPARLYQEGDMLRVQEGRQ